MFEIKRKVHIKSQEAHAAVTALEEGCGVLLHLHSILIFLYPDNKTNTVHQQIAVFYATSLLMVRFCFHTKLLKVHCNKQPLP